MSVEDSIRVNVGPNDVDSSAMDETFFFNDE